MFTVAFREFKSLFTSIRSILMIGFLFGVTVGAARLVRQFEAYLQELGLGRDAYVMGLMLLLILAAPLFVTSLSHNIVNKEMDTRTIRFLATKTSRRNIILGKFIGSFLFWAVCLTVALLLIIPFSKSFSILNLIRAIIFVSYFIGLDTVSINRYSKAVFKYVFRNHYFDCSAGAWFMEYRDRQYFCEGHWLCYALFLLHTGRNAQLLYLFRSAFSHFIYCIKLTYL